MPSAPIIERGNLGFSDIDRVNPKKATTKI